VTKYGQSDEIWSVILGDWLLNSNRLGFFHSDFADRRRLINYHRLSAKSARGNLIEDFLFKNPSREIKSRMQELISNEENKVIRLG
jgi:hypothetical protein